MPPFKFWIEGILNCFEKQIGSQGKELRSPPGSLIGLPTYVAPEILLSAQSGSTYNGQVIQSSGVCCAVFWLSCKWDLQLIYVVAEG